MRNDEIKIREALREVDGLRALKRETEVKLMDAENELTTLVVEGGWAACLKVDKGMLRGLLDINK